MDRPKLLQAFKNKMQGLIHLILHIREMTLPRLKKRSQVPLSNNLPSSSTATSERQATLPQTEELCLVSEVLPSGLPMEKWSLPSGSSSHTIGNSTVAEGLASDLITSTNDGAPTSPKAPCPPVGTEPKANLGETCSFSAEDELPDPNPTEAPINNFTLPNLAANDTILSLRNPQGSK
jgi:hypothetical protein